MATGANLIQSPHVHERLSRAYGIKGSALAPELNPSLQPVVIVDNLDVEADAYALNRRACVGYCELTQGDGATTFPSIGIVWNPAGPETDFIIRVSRVYFCPLSAASYTVAGFLGTPGANLSVPAVIQAKDYADIAIQGKPNAELRQSAAGGALLAGPISMFRISGNGHQEIPFPVVLRRGQVPVDQALWFQARTISSIALTIWWTEEPARR